MDVGLTHDDTHPKSGSRDRRLVSLTLDLSRPGRYPFVVGSILGRDTTDPLLSTRVVSFVEPRDLHGEDVVMLRDVTRPEI